MILIFKSFLAAFNGLVFALKNENNFRIQWCCGLAVFLFNIIFDIPLWQEVSLLFLVGAVLSFELINTALEKTLDIFDSTYHIVIKNAKDLSAASVLIFSLFSLAIFTLILFNNYTNVISTIYNEPFFIPLLFIFALINIATALKKTMLIGIIQSFTNIVILLSLYYKTGISLNLAFYLSFTVFYFMVNIVDFLISNFKKQKPLCKVLTYKNLLMPIGSSISKKPKRS